jgi:chromosomal replication initiation ATPase DnaA
MANLHQATERLQAALDRLEQAVGEEPSTAAPSLRDALATARRENAQLQKVARTVADRLDTTIARLKSGQPG